MSDERIQPPSADEIERRFSSTAVELARPLMRGGLAATQFLCAYGWTAFDLDVLERIDGPFIMAANHQSHADTAAIIAVLPRAVRRRTCVAAALDVFGPLGRAPHVTLAQRLGRESIQLFTAAAFHAFAFDRQGSPLRSVRTATELVRRGWNLIIYPEGTRSRTGEMSGFKPGIGLLARATERPVVPIFVDGGASILPCGAALPRSGHAFVHFGRPLTVGPNESAGAFTQRLQDAIRAMQARARLVRPAPPILTMRAEAAARY